MGSVSEQVVVPGTPSDWRDFEVEDYDPAAAPDSDEDTLGELLAERSEEDMFGVVLVADPVENVPDDLIRRLAGLRVPTKLRRESRDEDKPKKKAKKDKD